MNQCFLRSNSVQPSPHGLNILSQLGQTHTIDFLPRSPTPSRSAKSPGHYFSVPAECGEVDLSMIRSADVLRLWSACPGWAYNLALDCGLAFSLGSYLFCGMSRQ